MLLLRAGNIGAANADNFVRTKRAMLTRIAVTMMTVRATVHAGATVPREVVTRNAAAEPARRKVLEPVYGVERPAQHATN